MIKQKLVFWIDPWNFDSSKEFQLLDDLGHWGTCVELCFWDVGRRQTIGRWEQGMILSFKKM